MATGIRIANLLLRARCLALLGLGACSTSFDWQQVHAGEVPFEDVWRAMVEVAQVDGYPVDQAATDRGKKVFVSRWRARELPFRRSSRKRVHAEFEQVERSWTIRYYVEQQEISNLARAFDPEEDDWKATGQDHDTERRFGIKLERRFQDAAARRERL